MKVVVPGGPPCVAGQYGVLEGLGQVVAPGAGGSVIVIPGWMGAEAGLP